MGIEEGDAVEGEVNGGDDQDGREPNEPTEWLMSGSGSAPKRGELEVRLGSACVRLELKSSRLELGSSRAELAR